MSYAPSRRLRYSAAFQLIWKRGKQKPTQNFNLEEIRVGLGYQILEEMWHYFIAHVIYYITRCFPKNNRGSVRLFCIFISFLFLIPQLIVLTLNTTQRFCAAPLLTMLIMSIGTTFAMLAFGFLFTMMEPVPWKLRLSFHFFGAFSFLVGILHFSYAVTGKDCEKTTTELYYVSMAFGVFSIITTVFYVLLLPFWVIEFLCQGRVLNRKERRGICYEPVSNCPCLWRV